jgi:hypothetical protein
MRTYIISLLLAPFAFFGVSSCAEAVPESDTFFSVSGDITVSVDQATAQLVRIGDKIPALTIGSAPASIKKLGTSYSVNLFFSNDFDPQPGTYPVEFSYRKHPNTLGGSFMQSAERFSHDTKGTVEFIEFGEQVRVRFEFQVFDSSEGREGRQGVTVKGEAVCPWVDIF